MKNKTLCNECGKEFNSKGALTKHMKTHQTDLHDVDASILRENFNKKKVLKFSNSNTLEETAEKFNLNRRVLEDWLKIASRQFCCEFCSKGFAVRWRLTEHQKRLHFTKEEWAISVEGRRWRQNIDVMPSREEMFTKKYLNTPEQKVNQSFDENKYKEVKATIVDAHDVKEEVDDERPSPCSRPCPSPCPSPGQSPKRTSDENEFALKEEVEESFF